LRPSLEAEVYRTRCQNIKVKVFKVTFEAKMWTARGQDVEAES